MKSLLITTLAAALVFGATTWAQNAPRENAPPKSPPSAAEKSTPARKPAAYPFRGTLKAVDRDAMTLILAGKDKDRVIRITSQTRFTREGKPATLEDALLNGQVAGTVRKSADGRSEEAVTVRFGPAPEKSTGGRKPKTE